MKDKINLYEKLWFGKYMGSRLIDIIDSDIKHVNKMMLEGFMFSDEAMDYYNAKMNTKKRDRYVDSLRLSFNNPWDTDNDEPQH